MNEISSGEIVHVGVWVPPALDFAAINEEGLNRTVTSNHSWDKVTAG